jgi:predicted transcriptional regulator
MDGYKALSRRERQIMDIVYGRGKATATDVLADMPDPPSRASVRTLLRILEDKGHLKHRARGREFVYEPVRPRTRVGRSALRRVLETFYDGSLEQAVAALLADRQWGLTEEQLNRLARLIRQARRGSQDRDRSRSGGSGKG